MDVLGFDKNSAPWDSRGCIKKPRRLLTQGVGAGVVVATVVVDDSTGRKIHVEGVRAGNANWGRAPLKSILLCLPLKNGD